MKGIESPVPLGRIQQGILLIRGKRVMLDADLADLYGVSTEEEDEREDERPEEEEMEGVGPDESEGGAHDDEQ
jgi:hypothetical protein